TMVGAGEPLRVPAARVTTEFFRVLQMKPAIGRDFEAGEEQVVILSDGLWRSRFRADPGVLGRQVKLDGSPHTGIGVMPAGPAFPADAELWTRLDVVLNSHVSFFRPVIARLKPGQTMEQARQAFLG